MAEQVSQLIGGLVDGAPLGEVLAEVAAGASSALQRPVTAADVSAACDLAGSVLAEPPADPYDVLVTPWHPCLAGKGVAQLSEVLRLWDYLLVDMAACDGVYAHVAQRYAKAKSAVWERRAADEALRGAVVAWWTAHYGDGSKLAQHLKNADNSHEDGAPACICEGELEALARFPCASILRGIPSSDGIRVALGIGGIVAADMRSAARLGMRSRMEAAVLAGAQAGDDPLRVTAAAAESGDLACLVYAIELGYECDESTCAAAARGGHLTCLTYLHEHDCPWDEETTIDAAHCGHLACLRYAHEHGCPWDEATCSWAANNGHLDCLMYAHEHGCPWDEGTCSAAASNGHLACLVYAHEQGCPWDEHTCDATAIGDHLACLMYAHEQGAPWEAGMCGAAAVHGSLSCLRYAHEHGCPWDVKTCRQAAAAGRLACLTYAHEHGCPWDEDTCGVAASYGHLECLRYAHEHGCPWNADVFRFSSSRVQVQACLAYARAHGCPT
jgi:hypothetical protein